MFEVGLQEVLIVVMALPVVFACLFGVALLGLLAIESVGATANDPPDERRLHGYDTAAREIEARTVEAGTEES